MGFHSRETLAHKLNLSESYVGIKVRWVVEFCLICPFLLFLLILLITWIRIIAELKNM